MSGPTVACVLRASDTYTPEYVTRLYEGVRKHWSGDLDFVALTDTPINHPGVRDVSLAHDWPGWWSKLELFRPDLTGRLLYFDLDTMIVGSLGGIQEERRHTTLKRQLPKYAGQINSGMMMLPQKVRAPVWKEWIKGPRRWMRKHAHGGDQAFLQSVWGLRRVRFWQDEYPGQVCSYRMRVLRDKRVPPGTRVVYFHGKPRPHEIGWRLPQ